MTVAGNKRNFSHKSKIFCHLKKTQPKRENYSLGPEYKISMYMLGSGYVARRKEGYKESIAYNSIY